MVRTFIAIDLAPEVRERLSESQDTLKQCSARLTLVDPENIHLTLKFLGEVSPAQIEQITGVLREIAGTPFDISLDCIVGNTSSRPRVIWCTISDEGACTSLAGRIEEALAPLGFRREDRPFTPHVTVARVRNYDPSLSRALKEVGARRHGTCRITGFSLKKSTLTPQGPIYEDIEKVTW